MTISPKIRGRGNKALCFFSLSDETLNSSVQLPCEIQPSLSKLVSPSLPELFPFGYIASYYLVRPSDLLHMQNVGERHLRTLLT